MASIRPAGPILITDHGLTHGQLDRAFALTEAGLTAVISGMADAAILTPFTETVPEYGRRGVGVR